MPDLKACPTLERLSDYLQGKLGPAERDSVSAHIESCDACFSRLDQVDDSNDLLLSSLRRPAIVDPFMKEPECQLAVERSEELYGQFEKGTNLLRDYELIEMLGEGGMGTVYSAVHTKLDKSVAIKLLPADRRRNTAAISRFEREMKAIGKLHHSNIVQAYDAGEVAGKHFLVMERVNGFDLSTLVKRLGKLPVPDACEAIRQAALGLQHAHEHELVHRDVKPSNIMVTHEGNIKILDLGLALFDEPVAEGHELTSTGQIMGTLDYMAPEQLGDSHAIDLRADVYSLGATLYKLLTGRAPYADTKYNTPQKKLMAIATKPVAPAGGFRDDVPAELAGVLDRMLAKNPDERFATAMDVAIALDQFCRRANLAARVEEAEACEAIPEEPSRQSTVDPVASSFTDTRPSHAKPEGQPACSADGVRIRRRRFWPIATFVGFVFAIAVLTVFYVRSANSTLMIELDNEKVAVELRRHGLIVRDKKTGREYEVWKPGETKLAAGDYRLLVTDDVGLKVDTDEFAISRGGRQIVTVRLLKKPTRVNGTAESCEPMSSMALVAQPTKIEGVNSWSIESTALRGYVNPHGHPLATSPNNKLVAVASVDGVLRVYDLLNGELIHAWLGHEGRVNSVAWSADGSYLATIGEDERAFIWNASNGRVVSAISVPGAHLVEWFPQSTLLAIAGHHLTLWKPSGTRQIANPGIYTALAFAPDGKTLAFANGNSNIQLWNTDTQKLIGAIQPADARGNHATFVGLAWSPDGTALLSGSDDGRACLWDPIKRVLLHSLGDNSFVRRRNGGASNGLAWSPDSTTIAICQTEPGGTHIIAIRDAKTGQLQDKLRLESVMPSAGIVWSNDGRTIAGVTKGGRLIAYGMPERTVRFQIRKREHVNGVARQWAPMGHRLICTLRSKKTDPSVQLWDLQYGLRWQSKAEIASVALAWAPNGKYLALAGYDSVSIVERGTVAGKMSCAPEVLATAWNADSTKLAIGAGEVVQIWNPRTKTVVDEIEIQGSRVSSLAWSITNSLAVGTSDGKTQIRDLNSERPLLEAKHDTVYGVGHLTFSPNGSHLAAADWDGDVVRIWDGHTGALVLSLGGDLHIEDLMWSDDGEEVVVACEDGVTRIWDLLSDDLAPQTLPRITVPKPHEMGLSPDRRLVAAGDEYDSSKWICNLNTGAPLCTLTGLREGRIIQISPEGHFMASADVDDEIVYVGETLSGERFTLSREEFEMRFGWKNDPEKARISMD